VEVRDRRTNRQEQLFGFLQLVSAAAIGGITQVVQGGRQNLGRRIEEGDAARLQLLDVFGLEHQVPGIDRSAVAEHGLDLVDVVTDADGAPHVGDRVQIARIARLQRLEQVGVEVLPVGQLGLVQLLKYAGLDLLGEEGVGRNHYVVTGAAGQQLGFQHFVAVKDVVDDLDAGFLLEIGQGVRCDVVGPVVDVQHLVVSLSSACHGRSQGQREKGLAECFHAYSS